MKKTIIAALVAALSLTACKSPAERRQIAIDSARSDCLQMGYSAGNGLAECTQGQVQAQDMQSTALTAAILARRQACQGTWSNGYWHSSCY